MAVIGGSPTKLELTVIGGFVACSESGGEMLVLASSRIRIAQLPYHAEGELPSRALRPLLFSDEEARCLPRGATRANLVVGGRAHVCFRLYRIVRRPRAGRPLQLIDTIRKEIQERLEQLLAEAEESFAVHSPRSTPGAGRRRLRPQRLRGQAPLPVDSRAHKLAEQGAARRPERRRPACSPRSLAAKR